MITNAVKTAPMSAVSKLIKNFQDSPAMKIDPRLKDSVAHLICHKRLHQTCQTTYCGVQLLGAKAATLAHGKLLMSNSITIMTGNNGVITGVFIRNNDVITM